MPLILKWQLLTQSRLKMNYFEAEFNKVELLINNGKFELAFTKLNNIIDNNKINEKEIAEVLNLKGVIVDAWCMLKKTDKNIW